MRSDEVAHGENCAVEQVLALQRPLAEGWPDLLRTPDHPASRIRMRGVVPGLSVLCSNRHGTQVMHNSIVTV